MSKTKKRIPMGSKRKNEKTIAFFIEYGAAKHRFSGHLCSENQGTRQFHPRIGSFFRFCFRETDHTNVLSIRTKGEGLKRLRSREISCEVKCIFTGTTGGILADFFTSSVSRGILHRYYSWSFVFHHFSNLKSSGARR